MIRNKYKRVVRRCPLYRVWAGMLRRCYNVKHKDYPYYGGRGILVSDYWQCYENFYTDMHSTYSKGLRIERIDSNANYCSENCIWTTAKQQAINRRSSNLLTNPKTGEVRTITDWAIKLGLSRNTITSRIRLGRTDFNILTAPSKGRKVKVLLKQYKVVD